MPSNFKYNTVATNSIGEYKEKGSKFTAYLYPINSIDEFKDKLERLKNDFSDARHHCYAYRLGAQGEVYRANDDGEPSGTAGKPIYNQLLSNEITNICVIVVRYFGGTKLGVSGLINAYKEATYNAISKNEIIEKTLSRIIKIETDYNEIPYVNSLKKRFSLDAFDEQFTDKVELKIKIPLNQEEEIISLLKANHKLIYTYIS